jgi:hypothetical protein
MITEPAFHLRGASGIPILRDDQCLRGPLAFTIGRCGAVGA